MTTALAGAAILSVLYRFNSLPRDYDAYLVTNVTALLWIPLLLIAVVHRREASEFGLSMGDARWGLRAAGLLFLVSLPAYLIASRMPDFQAYYPIWKQAAHDPAFFRYYELTYGMYLFCWEFFFRGFLLFGLSKRLGPWIAVFVQAAAFGIMHLGKPGAEVAASFATGVVLGWVALRARSFLPGFLVHWASAFTFDVLVILAVGGGAL